MIHPTTELRFVSQDIGYGVFATADIPKGTIVYVKDKLEIEITRLKFRKLDKTHREIVEKYSYMDEHGVRIVSWDHAKYVNHRCECNTMSCGYGFELAIRDIAADEEITDEYGLFNIPVPVPVYCNCTNCRGMLLPDDIERYAGQWDLLVSDALQHLTQVEQPLWPMMDARARADVTAFLAGKQAYRSVRALKCTQLEATASLNGRLPSRPRQRAL